MTNTSNKGLVRLTLGLALVAMLALGLAAGLWFRLQALPERVVEVVVTATPDPAEQPVTQVSEQADTSASKSEAQTENDAPTPQTQAESGAISEDETAAEQTTSDETTKEATTGPEAAPTPSIMEFLLADARHFAGDPEAPVTLIEFSDFK